MRVLITSLSAGSGHVRAAEAILAAFQKTSPEVEVAHVDVADFVTPNFRRLYVEGYRVTVNRAPGLWGRIYRYWDDQPAESALLPLLHRAQRACATAFFAYLHRFRPDRIISTHFLIPQLLGAASLASGQRASPDHWQADRTLRCCSPRVETVITDYDVHRFWVSDVVARYYVAHPDMATTLARYGVPSSRVVASGIPVHPFFSESASPASIFRDLKLDSRRPVILVLSGGLGLNELQHAVERLFSLPGDVQIITVSGKNEALRARLEKIQPPPSIRLLNLGYVRNMHELLTISSVVITKPGGLTVSEGLAKQKLMILFSPIPGQEEKNAEFLVSHGAALYAPSLNDLPQLTAQLLNDTRLRERILANVANIARPQAAYTIAETVTHTSRLAA